MRSAILSIAYAAAIVPSLPSPAAANSEPTRAIIADGRDIARKQCSGCHAVGRRGASPRADAPPLRQVLHRYRSDALAQDLMEGVKLGHPDMPQFQFSPRGVDALVAYLRTIQIPTKRPDPPAATPQPR